MALPSISNPIRKREDGSLEISGLTPAEATKGSAALLVVWAIVAGFTAVMFIAAKSISGEPLERPGAAS